MILWISFKDLKKWNIEYLDSRLNKLFSNRETLLYSLITKFEGFVNVMLVNYISLEVSWLPTFEAHRT